MAHCVQCCYSIYETTRYTSYFLKNIRTLSIFVKSICKIPCYFFSVRICIYRLELQGKNRLISFPSQTIKSCFSIWNRNSCQRSWNIGLFNSFQDFFRISSIKWSLRRTVNPKKKCFLFKLFSINRLYNLIKTLSFRLYFSYIFVLVIEGPFLFAPRLI